MSDMKDTDVTEHGSTENTVDEKGSTEEILDEKIDVDLSEHPDTLDQGKVNSMPSPQEEEATLKKKYGGILPRKPPLISKDSERAFFDSADWALGKQGAQKPKGPLEALRPKLQPTQQHTRSRRPSYSSPDSEDFSNDASEDANSSQ